MTDTALAGILISIQVGAVATLGPDAIPTAFVKTPTSGPRAIGLLGVEGDAQADHRVHGGPEMAVYAYPAAHYAAWAMEFPEHAALWGPGGVGENLTIDGLDERTVHLGDIYAIGGATLQVTQPREPCFKFAARFGDPGLPKAMIKTGRSGWYFRVLAPGIVTPGDRVRLVERINADWPVARLNRMIPLVNAGHAEVAALAALPGLGDQWRRRAAETATRAAQGSQQIS